MGTRKGRLTRGDRAGGGDSRRRKEKDERDSQSKVVIVVDRVPDPKCRGIVALSSLCLSLSSMLVAVVVIVGVEPFNPTATSLIHESPYSFPPCHLARPTGRPLRRFTRRPHIHQCGSSSRLRHGGCLDDTSSRTFLLAVQDLFSRSASARPRTGP